MGLCVRTLSAPRRYFAASEGATAWDSPDAQGWALSAVAQVSPETPLQMGSHMEFLFISMLATVKPGELPENRHFLFCLSTNDHSEFKWVGQLTTGSSRMPSEFWSSTHTCSNQRRYYPCSRVFPVELEPSHA